MQDSDAKALGVEFSLVEFGSVSSTNDLIKQAIENGSSEGLVVRAASQEGGYGRYGRSWSSPEGGLYMSVLLDPAKHSKDASVMATKLPTLSLLVSMAVRTAILDVIGNDFSSTVKIKWPNDIIYTSNSLMHGNSAMFQKICGISLEKHKHAICVGIGINVERPHACSEKLLSAQDTMSDASCAQNSKRNSPAYLLEMVSAENDISVEYLCNKVIQSLAKEYQTWLMHPFDCFTQEYACALALRGLYVRIENNRSAITTEGEVLGVDGQGCLLVKTQDGCLEHVSSGEAHVHLV